MSKSDDEIFKALSSAQRREIIRMLAGHSPDGKTCCGPREVCACRFSEGLGIAPSTVSHHMAVLRRAGLVTSRKDGQWVHYTLQRDALQAALDRLEVL